MPEPIEEFIQRARVHQLDPEEIQSELKALYGIELPDYLKVTQDLDQDPRITSPTPKGTLEKAWQGIHRFGGGEDELEVPAGMRPKTVIEELGEPVAAMAGGAIGAAETLGSLTVPSLLRTTGMHVPELTKEKKSKEALWRSEEESRKVIEERLGEAAIENIRSDLRDNIEGIIEISRVLRQTDDFVSQGDDWTDTMVGARKSGEILGEGLVVGSIADLDSFFEDPSGYINARPITSAMIVAPLAARLSSFAAAKWGPAVKAKLSPTVQNALSALEKIDKKIKLSPKGVIASKTVKKAAGGISKWHKKAIRFIKDPTSLDSASATALVTLLMEEVNHTGASINQVAQRWANAQKHGEADITPRIKDDLITGGKEGIVLSQEKITKLLEDQKGLRGLKLTPEQYAEYLDSMLSEISGGTPVQLDWLGPERKAQVKKQVRQPWDSPTSTKTFTQPVEYNPTTAHFGVSKKFSRKMADIFDEYLAEVKDIEDSGMSTIQAEGIAREAYTKKLRSYLELERTPSDDIRIVNTSWGPLATKFAEEMGNIKGLTSDAALTRLNEMMASISVGQLRSKTVIEKTVNKILEKVEEANIYTHEQLANLREKLPNYLEEINKRDPDSPSYRVNPELLFGASDNPLKINVLDVVAEVLAKDPTSYKRVGSELITEVGRELSQEARLANIKEGLEKHMPVFESEPELISHILKRGGDDMPTLIQGNPHQLATRMLDAIDEWSEHLAGSKKPLELTRANILIKKIAHKLRTYQRMPDDQVGFFGLEGNIKGIKGDLLEKRSPLPEVLGDEKGISKFETEVFAPEGVIDTLKFEMNAQKATREVKGFWQKLTQRVKGNITARNLSSALNNIQGNFFYQTFRRSDPLLSVSLIKIWDEYRTWTAGKHVDKSGLTPEKHAFFESMERTGYLDTSLPDIELGGIGTTGSATKKIDRFQEKFYKAGDSIFKLEDAWYNYERLSNDINQLAAGEWIDINVKGRKKSRLKRESVNRGGVLSERWTLDDVQLTKKQLDDVIASTSAQPGRNIFVDFSAVPNAIKALRATKMLGIASPFFTWMYTVMDIPFLKKGLISRLMSDGVGYTTNSPTLLKKQVKDAVKISTKRAVILGGMRDAVVDPNNSEILRKVLGYSPKDFNLQLLDLTTNPLWIGHDSVESANQFSPSDIWLRAILAGQTWVEDIDDVYEELYPMKEGTTGLTPDIILEDLKKTDRSKYNDIMKRRKIFKRQLSGEGLTAEDALSLIALSGSPILDAVMVTQKAGEIGSKVDKTKVVNLLLMALMGGTQAKLLDASVAQLSDYLGGPTGSKLWTTRKWAENAIGEPQERMIKWAMRRMTGIGFKVANIGSRSEWYWKKKEREWKLSLTGNLVEALNDPELQLPDQDRENIEARIFQLHKIVEGEIGLEKLRFDEVYQNLLKQIKEKKKKR